MSRRKPLSNAGRPVMILLYFIIAVLIGLAVWSMLPQKALLDSNETVLSVNGHKVGAEEFRFYMNRLLDTYLPVYGEEYLSKDTIFSGLVTIATNYIRQNYLLYDWAAEIGFTLTDDLKAAAAEQLAQYKASFETEEAYRDALKKAGTSEKAYLNFLEMNKVIEAFNAFLYDPARSPFQIADEDVLPLAEAYGIYGAKHIFFFLGETDEEKAANREKIEAAYARLNAGENFEDLMFELSEDPGLSSYPDGYTFGPDSEFNEDFYNGTKILEIGQHTGIITSVDGYHIIKRIEPNFDDARYLLMAAMADNEFAKRNEEAQIVYSPRFGEISYEDFRSRSAS